MYVLYSMEPQCFDETKINKCFRRMSEMSDPAGRVYSRYVGCSFELADHFATRKEAKAAAALAQIFSVNTVKFEKL